VIFDYVPACLAEVDNGEGQFLGWLARKGNDNHSGQINADCATVCRSNENAIANIVGLHIFDFCIGLVLRFSGNIMGLRICIFWVTFITGPGKD
jgi:hypothetical protein